MAKNNWLKGCSEIMVKYAEELPAKQDRLSIRFEYPEASWVPVHFIKNGVDLGILEFSDVYDSFVPIREKRRQRL